MNNWNVFFLGNYLLLYLNIYPLFLLYHLYFKIHMMLLNVVPLWMLLSGGLIIDYFYIQKLPVIFLPTSIHIYKFFWNASYWSSAPIYILSILSIPLNDFYFLRIWLIRMFSTIFICSSHSKFIYITKCFCFITIKIIWSFYSKYISRFIYDWIWIKYNYWYTICNFFSGKITFDISPFDKFITSSILNI
jgi:hypothetical protein